MTLTPREAVQAAVWLIHNDTPWALAESVYGDNSHSSRFERGLSHAWARMDPEHRERFVDLAVQRYGAELVRERELRPAVKR